MKTLAVAAALAAALTACASGSRPAAAPASSVKKVEGGFVYGHLALPAELGTPTCVVLAESEHERVSGAPHGCLVTSPDGLFYGEDLRPTRYVVDGVIAGGALHRLGDAAPFRLDRGALHPWGAFRLDPAGAAGKPALVRAEKPTDAELLRSLLAKDGISGRWKERLQKRLSEQHAVR